MGYYRLWVITYLRFNCILILTSIDRISSAGSATTTVWLNHFNATLAGASHHFTTFSKSKESMQACLDHVFTCHCHFAFHLDTVLTKYSQTPIYSRPLSIVPLFIVTPYETFPIIPPPSLPICLVQHKDFPLSIVPSVYNPHFPKFLYCQKGGTIDRGPL